MSRRLPGWIGEPASSPRSIALISATILILELAFIRQVPAEVRAIAYFTNLLLMAAFFGIGLGCILQEYRSLAPLLPLGLLLAFTFVYLARGLVVYAGTTEVHYWLQYGAEVAGSAYEIPLFAAAAAAFLVCSMPFIALGQALARAMDRQRLHLGMIYRCLRRESEAEALLHDADPARLRCPLPAVVGLHLPSGGGAGSCLILIRAMSCGFESSL